MATRHTVTLALGDPPVELTAWDEIAITHDLRAPASGFALTVWREPDGERWNSVLESARLYAPLTLTVDGAVQLRGSIERMRPGGNRSGAPLTLGGRGLAGAAMTAHVDPALSLRGVSLADALTRIFRPLGIPVTVGVAASDARAVQAGARPGPVRQGTHRLHHRVDRYRPRPGTTVWQAADTLCRRHGYLLYAAPTAAGLGLVVDRPAYDAPVERSLTRTKVRRDNGGVLAWEGNILEGFRDVNATEVPTEVTVFGHSGLDAPQDARHRGRVSNDVLMAHPLVASSFFERPHYLRDPRARTPQVAEQRARRELARAMEEFDVYEATVQGFSQDGHLWAINAMVHIDDELAGVRGDWLTTRVTFTRSRAGGHVTRLRLVPRGSLVIEPDPEV